MEEYCPIYERLCTGFLLVTGFIEFLWLETTCHNESSSMHTVLNSLKHTLSFLNLLHIYQSSYNGFQRQTFPFLWVPELSPRLNHNNSWLIPLQLQLSQEDSL
jgi:hypothetical protein